MKTIDDEVVPEALRFMTDAKDSDTPFFVWLNTTHMHFRTHIKDGSRGKAGRWQSEYHDTMVDHDELVGSGARLPRRARARRQHDRHVLHRQRAAHEHLARRRHDAVPQREELQLGGRLPRAGDGALARSASRPGQVLNGIVSHNDWFVTLLAAAGDTDVADRLKAGRGPERDDVQGAPRRPQPARLPHRRGRREPATALLLRLRRRRPHRAALRQLEVRLPRAARHGHAAASGPSPYTELRVPKIFNLRTDPYERADITSNTYYDWLLDHAWSSIPAQAYVAQMLQTLAEFPPRQEPASFSIDKVLEKLRAGVRDVSSGGVAAVSGRCAGLACRAGLFTMGSDDHYPEEAPTHRVRVDAFAIDAPRVRSPAVLPRWVRPQPPRP